MCPKGKLIVIEMKLKAEIVEHPEHHKEIPGTLGTYMTNISLTSNQKYKTN